MTHDMEQDGPGYAIGYLEDVEVGPDILEYLARIEATFMPYGGEWLVHGTPPDVLEGQLPGDVVLIGFPSAAAAQQWYDSPAYQDIQELRTRRSRSIVAVLHGVPAGYTAADTIAKLGTAPLPNYPTPAEIPTLLQDHR